MAGDGTLYQRKSNSKWYVIYNTGNKIINSKGHEVYEQKWHDLETTDKNIAKERKKLFMADLARNIYREPIKRTVEDVVSEWAEGNKTRISSRTGKPLGKRTVKEYDKIIKNHIIPEVGTIQVKDFNRKKAQILIEKKAIESKFTARKVYVILKCAFDYVFQDEEQIINPTTKVITPKQPKIKHPTWTADQAFRILDEAEKTILIKDYGIILASLHQGLRIGEILGFDLKNIDFANEKAEVCQKLTIIDGKPIIEDILKTDSTRRTIVLTPTVIEVWKKIKGDRIKGLLFTDSIGGTIRLENFRNRTFNPLIERYNEKQKNPDFQIPKIRIHDMRHSAGTILYKLFKDIKLVQIYLGHATISMAADTYIHEDEDMLREAAAAIDNALKKKPR